jgi:hypothetical protein
MSEGPAEQYADSTRMPEVELHYECTRGTAQCREDAKYLVRAHTCSTKRTGEGGLFAACQKHIDEWQALEYPVRCANPKCRHAFNGPLDIIWEVHEL